ncbi:MAG: hypothetical protein KatS3mg109_1226 [Pirellulaceae bacterium]|nr:MAG: hypothetical protein KatS3mg109_1226 [Pirellulaceae bacterium]GIW94855.1 MAG: hypothetical protein KatS3mg110_2896 [Pirellulaceae bacterium]
MAVTNVAEQTRLATHAASGSTRLPLWLDGVLLVSAVLVGAAGAWWVYEGGGMAGLVRHAEPGQWVRGRVSVTRHPPFYELGCSDWVWRQKVKVTNPWNIPLEVSDIRASCNCTQPHLESRTIAPHGETWMELQATIIPQGQPTHVQVELRCRSGHRLVHLLSVARYRAAVVESADATSANPEIQKVDFGALWPGQSAERRLRVTMYYDPQHPESIPGGCRVEPLAKQITASVGALRHVEAVHGGAVGRIETDLVVKATAGQTAGNESGDVRLVVQYPGGREETLPLNVAWSVRSIWQWEPASVFVELEPDERAVRQVICRLGHAAGVPFRIREIQAAAPWLEARAVPGSEMSQGGASVAEASQESPQKTSHVPGDDADHVAAAYQQIVVRIRADAVGDWAAQELEVPTDLPDQPAAKLRVAVKRKAGIKNESSKR